MRRDHWQAQVRDLRLVSAALDEPGCHPEDERGQASQQNPQQGVDQLVAPAGRRLRGSGCAAFDRRQEYSRWSAALRGAGLRGRRGGAGGRPGDGALARRHDGHPVDPGWQRAGVRRLTCRGAGGGRLRGGRAGGSRRRRFGRGGAVGRDGQHPQQAGPQLGVDDPAAGSGKIQPLDGDGGLSRRDPAEDQFQQHAVARDRRRGQLGEDQAQRARLVDLVDLRQVGEKTAVRPSEQRHDRRVVGQGDVIGVDILHAERLQAEGDLAAHLEAGGFGRDARQPGRLGAGAACARESDQQADE